MMPRKRKWLTPEQLDQIKNWESKIADDAINRAQQVCGKIPLKKLSDQEKRETSAEHLKATHALLRSSRDEGLLDAWRVLHGADFIVITDGMYNFIGGSQADLKRFMQIFHFRKWTRLADHVLVGGKKIDVHSMTSQQPGPGENSDTWRAITFLLEKNELL